MLTNQTFNLLKDCTRNSLLNNSNEITWYKTGSLCYTSSLVNDNTYLICRYTDTVTKITKVSITKLDDQGCYVSENDQEFETDCNEYNILNELYEMILNKHLVPSYEGNKLNFISEVA